MDYTKLAKELLAVCADTSVEDLDTRMGYFKAYQAKIKEIEEKLHGFLPETPSSAQSPEQIQVMSEGQAPHGE